MENELNLPAVVRSPATGMTLREEAVMAFESGLLPKSVDTRQKAITIALMGRDLGLSPMQSLTGIYVVNGMPALRASLMLRLIYERVHGANITVLTPPDKADFECEVEMKRPGGKPHVFRFTLDDARKGGFLSKATWQQHTSTMLRWAAIRTGARIVFADAIAGCYMEDEIPEEGAKQTQSPTPDPAPRVEVLPGAGPAALPPSQPDRPITEKQLARLFAIAHGKKWSRQDVDACMEEEFEKTDPKALTRAEYDTLCNFILSSETKDADPVITVVDWEDLKSYAGTLGIPAPNVLRENYRLFDKRPPNTLLKSELAKLRAHLEAEAAKALGEESEKGRDPGDAEMPDAREQAAAEMGQAPQVGA